MLTRNIQFAKMIKTSVAEEHLRGAHEQAIESDGNYCIYKPNDSVIQKGKYTEKGNVLTLDGNAKDIMYHSDEDIIYNLEKKSLVVFKRESKMPTYVGLDDSELE